LKVKNGKSHFLRFEGVEGEGAVVVVLIATSKTTSISEIPAQKRRKLNKDRIAHNGE